MVSRLSDGPKPPKKRLWSVVVALACASVFSSIGGAPGFPAGLRAVCWSLLSPAPFLAAAYLFAGIGLGALFAPLSQRMRECATVRAGLGLAILMSLSHGLGVLGLLAGELGAVIAWAPIVLGLCLLAGPFISRAGRSKLAGPVMAPGETHPINTFLAYAAIPPIVLLFVAASMPPGHLWDSEFGGYDALSYHLALPQEWLKMGRIWPLEHNVYSYLPGYVEAAFTHLGAMSMAPAAYQQHGAPPPLSVVPGGLIAADGWRLLSCQYLHAGFTLFAASATSRAARAMVAAGTARVGDLPSGAHEDQPAIQAIVSRTAFLLFLATPWALVVGSLAYNEMAMLGLFACAIPPALGTTTMKGRDGILAAVVCAILIGAACGAKPTALLFCGVPVAILLFATTPARSWAGVVVAGCLTGVAMLAPWLVRNYLAAHNPVFPFAAAWFPNAIGGTGHWTAEQVARYRAGHHFSGSLTDALRLVFLQDALDPMGPTHRGIFHRQWFAFFPVVVIGGFLALRVRRHRWVAGAIALGVFAQLDLWLFTTHIQSRFLIPILIPGCILIGLGVLGLPARFRAPMTLVMASLQFAASTWVFVSQRSGYPTVMLGLPAAWKTGESDRPYAAEHPTELTSAVLDKMVPEQFVNLTVEPNAQITLIGTALPMFFTREVRYNTTWDSWPDLQALARGAGIPPDQPRYILADISEVRRLARSHFIQPGFTEEQLTAWLRQNTNQVRSWPEVGMVLARLQTPLLSPAPTQRPTPAPIPTPHAPEKP